MTGSGPGAAGKLVAWSAAGGFQRMITMPSSSHTLANIAMSASHPTDLLNPNHATLCVTDTAGRLSILDEVTGTVLYTFTAKRNGSQPWGVVVGAVILQPLAVPPPTITSVTATPTLGTAPIVRVPVACGVQVATPPQVSAVQGDCDGHGLGEQTTTTLTTTLTYTTAETGNPPVTVVESAGGPASATTTVTVQARAQAMHTAITSGHNGPINTGQKPSLITKLHEALGSINQGDLADACASLTSFDNNASGSDARARRAGRGALRVCAGGLSGRAAPGAHGPPWASVSWPAATRG